MNRSDLRQLAQTHGIRFVAGAVDCDEPTLLTFIERLLKENAQCPHCGQTLLPGAANDTHIPRLRDLLER